MILIDEERDLLK